MSSPLRSGDSLGRLRVQGLDTQSSTASPTRTREALVGSMETSQGSHLGDILLSPALELNHEGDMRDDSPPRAENPVPGQAAVASRQQDRGHAAAQHSGVPGQEEAVSSQQVQGEDSRSRWGARSSSRHSRRSSRSRRRRSKRYRQHRGRSSSRSSFSAYSSQSEHYGGHSHRGRSRSRSRSHRRRRRHAHRRGRSRSYRRERQDSRGRRLRSRDTQRLLRSRSPLSGRRAMRSDRAATPPRQAATSPHGDGPDRPTPELQRRQEDQRREQSSTALEYPRLYKGSEPREEHHVKLMMDPNQAYVLADSYLTRAVRRVDGLTAIFEPSFEPFKVLSLGTHVFAAWQYAAAEGHRLGERYVPLPPAASNHTALTSAHQQLVETVTALDPQGSVISPHVYRQRLTECNGLSRLMATYQELVYKGKEGAGKPTNLHVATTYYVVCLHHYMATGNTAWLTTRQDQTLNQLNEGKVALHCTACERLGHLAGQPSCPKTPAPKAGGSGAGGAGRGGGPSSGLRPYSGFSSRPKTQTASYGDDTRPNVKGAPAPAPREAPVPSSRVSDQESSVKSKTRVRKGTN